MKSLCAAVLFALVPPGAAQQPTPLDTRDLYTSKVAPAELKKPVQVPRGYAVLIGISRYQSLSEDENLAYPEKDVENLFSTLISKTGGNFEFANIRKLTGPQATLANIRDALENWLPSQATETDRVVVFFAGHGFVDDKRRGFFAPYDVQPGRLTDTAYPMARLGEVFSQKVRARWKFLIADACHSGKIAIDSTVSENLRGLPQDLITLTGSRASEKSFEDPQLAGGNGVFTYFLTKGWQGQADEDPADGVVTADELSRYVIREVRAYVKKRGGQQTPTELGDFSGDLILAYNPERRASLAARLPELSTGTVVIETNLEDVEITIDGQRVGSAGPKRDLRIPGLSSGSHKIQGARLGYEPVTVDVNVIPGSTETVTLRLLRQRKVNPQAQAQYDRGEETWRRSKSNPADLTAAAVQFSQALKADPAFSQAALALCRVQHAQGKAAEALRNCRKAIQIDDDYAEARSMAAVLFMETGDYEEAVRQLTRVAQQSPEVSSVHSLLAEALFLVGRLPEAERSASRAIALDDAAGQAFLIRGESLRAQKRFDEAIEDYHRALRLQEFRSSTVRSVAFYAVGTGMRKHRSGYQFLYRSQKASAYYGLCAAEIGRENSMRAVRYCQGSLSAERDDPETHLLLGEAYSRLFNHENRRAYLLRARENYEATLRLNPHVEKRDEISRKISDIAELLPMVK